MQSIAETDKGDSRTGDFGLRLVTLEPSEGRGGLGNDSTTISEGGFKARLVAAIGYLRIQLPVRHPVPNCVRVFLRDHIDY